MESNPSVAVLLVCYNQEDFIEEAVRSAADQDYDNLTVFVGDDGSQDNTLEKLQNLKTEYGDRLFIHNDNFHLGITGNCNRLLKACIHSDFIAFCGGDDVYLPGKIKHQVGWFREHPKGVLCGHDSEYFDSVSNKRLYLYSENVPLTSGTGIDYFQDYPCLYDAISIMVKSSVIPQGGFDNRIKVCSDIKLWLDVLSSGGEYGFIDGIYTRHRRHNFNVTNDPYKNTKDVCEAYSTIAKDYPELALSCKEKIDNLYLSLFLRAYTQEENFKKANFYLFQYLWISKLKINKLYDLLGFHNKYAYHTLKLMFHLSFPGLYRFIKKRKEVFENKQ